MTTDPQLSLYREIARSAWSRLAAGMDQPLTESEVVQIRGIGDRLDVDEVREVYLPLSRLLSIWANGFRQVGADVSDFLGRSEDTRTPFVVGVAGSVSVGKSTIARLLRELMSRWSTTPRVELVTTDGFLHPNAELERRGLMERKGFPES
ncbi:MAG: type I pantothenate kinase, partial [Microbacterium sp.]